MVPIPMRSRAVSAARSVSHCVLRPLPFAFVVLTGVLFSGCSYVDRARQGTDLVVGVAEQYRLETLVQADIERQRVRAARCYSPLLTPATLSAAAEDARLGPAWVDDLLRDCPRFGAFVSELMMRRARAAGIVTMLPMAAPPAAPGAHPLPPSAAPSAAPGPHPLLPEQALSSPAANLGGYDDGAASFGAVEP